MVGRDAAGRHRRNDGGERPRPLPVRHADTRRVRTDRTALRGRGVSPSSPHCHMTEGNVVVDFFTSRLRPRYRAMLDCVHSVAFHRRGGPDRLATVGWRPCASSRTERPPCSSRYRIPSGVLRRAGCRRAPDRGVCPGGLPAPASAPDDDGHRVRRAAVRRLPAVDRLADAGWGGDVRGRRLRLRLPRGLVGVLEPAQHRRRSAGCRATRCRWCRCSC